MAGMTKEQLLHYKYTLRNPNRNLHDLSLAFTKVKTIIDENVQEVYIREIFYARFLRLNTWAAIGLKCDGISADCVRKIVERYIKQTQT
jgi:hypothetical protein